MSKVTKTQYLLFPFWNVFWIIGMAVAFVTTAFTGGYKDVFDRLG